MPVLSSGNLIMVWDREEQGLTTIGGRIEGNESLDEALDREVMEEAGLVLDRERIPFACWYWESTDTYTVWFLVKVHKFVQMPGGYEKTGYVIMNFETAIQMIMRLEGSGQRVEIIRRAGILSGQLDEKSNNVM
nr:NUDIX domain-containing protein [Paenibacillus selenitireducens]